MSGLPTLPIIRQLSPMVWAILGLNPGAYTLQGYKKDIYIYLQHYPFLSLKLHLHVVCAAMQCHAFKDVLLTIQFFFVLILVISFPIYPFLHIEQIHIWWGKANRKYAHFYVKKKT
jgi:hypothetical protein